MSREVNPKVIGILTSGGDSQGMNAVIRAVVRLSLLKKFKIYLIYEGYNGLTEDPALIEEATLSTVDHILHQGGTFIHSSRCSAFRKPEGRVMAALNLIRRDMTNLVVVGGDGSLTGANILRKEWPSIIDSLSQTGKITDEMKVKNSSLNIVGIVGSIDNDFCRTDITTGVDTALYRIIEAVDAIATTAQSHRRIMIIEVMGRNCGYLALVSAIGVEATFTFIPECPPSADWHQYLCDKIEYERRNGKKLNIIIVSEGAVDLDGKAITPKQIMKVVSEKTKRDVRVTILGHIQRGGLASAYDRILGSRMGAKAVNILQNSDPTKESLVIAINGNQLFGKPLMDCVEQTTEIGIAMKKREWNKCLELRGSGFKRNLETYQMLQQIKKRSIQSNIDELNKYGVIQVGEPSPGMNAAVHSFVRKLITENHIIYGVSDGFSGLIDGKFRELKWSDVTGWVAQSGSLLGTSKVPKNITDEQMAQIAKNLKVFSLSGILLIGGFRAFELCVKMLEIRKRFDVKIPICIIPATVDNNIPGTDFSLGTDSTLNKITNLCTDILLSSRGTKRRLFIIKLETGYCGYLTILSALASGADYCYPFEDDFNEEDIRRDANSIKNKIIANQSNRLIIINGFANNKLQNKSIVDIYREVGEGTYTIYFVDLANLQQSSCPSPFDRIFGVKLGIKSAVWLMDNKNLNESENAVVIGMIKSKYVFSNITELINNTDFEYEIPKNQWCLQLKNLINECSN